MQPQSWGRLLIWQLSRRRSSTPSTKKVSHRWTSLKGVAVHRALYQNIFIESWLVGKGAQATEMTTALGRFKNLGELHKECTKARVIASRATIHRRIQEMGYSCHIPSIKPLLNQKQHKHLIWATEKKNWTVAQWSKYILHFIWKSSQSLEEEWRGTKSMLL